MIKKIKDIILPEAEEKKIILIDPSAGAPPEPDMRTVGLFADVNEEKIAEVIHSVLYFNELNKQAEKDKVLPITFYLSTYGGNADDMFALYDVMRNVRKNSEIHTIGLGKVMSAGVLLLSAGTKGKRQIGKNCRVMLHQPSGGFQGQATDIEIHAKEILDLKSRLNEIYHKHTGKPIKDIEKALERDNFLKPEDAKAFGLIDHVVYKRESDDK